MTERLFDRDSHLFSFQAEVRSCVRDGTGWKITLNRTAFFPEGGGQPGDTGILCRDADGHKAGSVSTGDGDCAGGERRADRVSVLDAQEENGEIVHICDGPLEPDTAVTGELDAELRLCRMQNHSGEHIFSGTAHRLYGCENVGFHMNDGDMTIDFDRELGEEELLRVEQEANEAVRANLPVKVWYPDTRTLAGLSYRSKKELSGAVRIVEIPGVDRCACCAPHVGNTGEVGLIKLREHERHRGGVRLSLSCGMWALEDYRTKQKSAAEISALLSAKRDEITPAVRRLLQERDALKEKNATLAGELIRLKAERQPETEGSLCLFEEITDEIAMRELVNLLVPKCGGLAAVFFPGEAGALRYIIGSRSVDLRRESKRINAGIGGRGGGRPEMIQGSATADPDTIRAFLDGFCCG